MTSGVIMRAALWRYCIWSIRGRGHCCIWAKGIAREVARWRRRQPYANPRGLQNCSKRSIASIDGFIQEPWYWTPNAVIVKCNSAVAEALAAAL